MKWTNRNGYPLLALTAILFAISYFLISILNHLLFRTYALDLGLFNQAMYSYSHFRSATYTLDITGADLPFFATHFSPVLYLFVPFYWLFGEYALLLLQVIAIISGGVGIYLLAMDFSGSRLGALMSSIVYYGSWGIYSAISFDFHNTVLAAAVVPWFFFSLKRGNIKTTFALFAFIIFCREDMALWMIFILAGILLMPRHRVEIPRKHLMIMAGISIVWFVVVLEVILPGLNNETAGQLSRYGQYGDSISAIIVEITTHPIQVLKDMYTNTTGLAEYDGIKQEFYLLLFLSGGIAVLLRPWYLVMIIPLVLQKMLANDYALWGINYQYSIGFTPILAMAVADLVSSIKKTRVRSVLFCCFAFITLLSTFSVLEGRTSKWYRRENSAFYRMEHYKRDINRKQVNEGLKLVPDEVPLSTCSELAPHLYRRQQLYHYPVMNNAEWIVLIKNTDVTYPLSREEYSSSIAGLRSSGDYRIIYESKDLLIMKKAD